MHQSVLSSRQIWLALVLIIVVGAFLRINASLHTTVSHPLRADAGRYFSYAYNVRHDGMYSKDVRFAGQVGERPLRPDAVNSPGYPLALLPFAGTVPTNQTILDITLAQAILGILIIPLVYLLARQLMPGAWPLLPSLLVAVSPQLIASGTYVLSETLFTFELLLSLVCLQLQFRHPEKLALAVLSGILIGLASLTRPTLQYFIPVVLLCALPLLPAGMRRQQGIALVFGFLVAFSPWLIRNSLTLGVASDPSLLIDTLVLGHYPDFMYQGRPETLGYPSRFDPRLGEIGASTATIIHEILRLFQTEPSTYFRWYLIGKPIAYLSWGDVAGAGDIFTYPTLQSPYFTDPVFKGTKSVMQFSHWFWVALALGTTMLIWLPRLYRNLDRQARLGLQILACVVLYFLAVHVVGFPIARYNIPILPVLFILAAYGLFGLTRYFHRRWYRYSCNAAPKSARRRCQPET